VTPMVDVMLVLLIIFMVVTPALLAGFNADPPQAVNIKDHPMDDQVDQVLGIDKDGNYYLNKKPIAQTDVAAALKHIYVDTPRDDYIMYFKGDKDLDYAKVLDAMDIAMHNGVKVVGMIGDQKPGTVSTVAGDTKQPPPGAK
jgi:biopolymer transport protein TolR